MEKTADVVIALNDVDRGGEIKLSLLKTRNTPEATFRFGGLVGVTEPTEEDDNKQDNHTSIQEE